MFTHDAATNVLYTCDAFGAHFCSTDPHDTDEAGLVPHFSLYYDCLMRPNARSVTTALRKVADMKVDAVATGHGPVLTRHIDGWVGRYGAWSAKAGAAAATVVLLHAGDYGASERLSLATARGLAKSGDVAVEQFDAATADAQELASAVARAAGVVVFAPPSDCPDAATSLATLVSSLKPGTRTLVAESYGGRDEPVDTLVASLVDAGAPPLIDALRVRSDPDDATAQRFEQAGTNLAKALTCKEAAARVKAAMGSDLAKALARVSGGLYVVTAARAGGGGASGAMVASWVAQAAFEPLAVTVAVAKDRAIESLLRVGDAFVLNVLSEDGAPAAMKHFLQRFPPGADRFAGVDWAPAAGCGAPVLAAAVAHCECAVVSRLETPDHYVVLAHVVEGGVADPNALTSVHRRKVATYY
jgi:flavin reductase (DIM6/NTAB) family NADH-FMN oxidoreductase RutF